MLRVPPGNPAADVPFFQIIPDRFQFFKGDIDRAVLAARQKQCALTILEILLDSGPARSADAQTSSGDVGGNLAFLQGVEMFKLFQTKGENIVVQRLRRTTEQTIQRRIVGCRISGIDTDTSTRVRRACVPDANACRPRRCPAHRRAIRPSQVRNAWRFPVFQIQRAWNG